MFLDKFETNLKDTINILKMHNVGGNRPPEREARREPASVACRRSGWTKGWASCFDPNAVDVFVESH